MASTGSSAVRTRSASSRNVRRLGSRRSCSAGQRVVSSSTAATSSSVASVDENAREATGLLDHLVDPGASQTRAVQRGEVRRDVGRERFERDRRETRAFEQRSELRGDRRPEGDAEGDAPGEPRDHVERIGVGGMQGVDQQRAVADLARDRGGDRVRVVLHDLVPQRVGEREQGHPRERAQTDAGEGRVTACVGCGAQERGLADALGSHHGDRSAVGDERRGTQQIGVPADEVRLEGRLAGGMEDRRHFRRFRRPTVGAPAPLRKPFVARTTGRVKRVWHALGTQTRRNHRKLAPTDDSPTKHCPIWSAASAPRKGPRTVGGKGVPPSKVARDHSRFLARRTGSPIAEERQGASASPRRSRGYKPHRRQLVH